MSVRDIIAQLRSGRPRADQAARWLRYGGYGCLLAVAWNAAFVYFDPLDTSQLPLPPNFNEGLVTLAAAGVLLILSGRGVAAGNSGAVLGARLALVLIVVLLAGFTYWMMWLPGRMGFGREPGPGSWIELAWPAVCLITSLQFFLPAYFAFGYLQRLKAVLEADAFRGGPAPPAPAAGIQGAPGPYCHALLPFGVHLTFFGVIAAGMLVFLLLSTLAKDFLMPVLLLPVFLLLFVGPILFNYRPSPFQKQRRVLDVATGGGSIFMLNGSWPFFRLLIYDDGLEVRFFLHAWFIPYARLESITLQRAFLSRALLIRSDLPRVPNRIRFSSSRQKELLARIEDCRDRHQNN